MGNFTCGPGEAVILECRPPPCRHWSVSLASWWWEAIDFAARQSSLNQAQAQLDGDGVFRGVIAHEDPGVPNWLDTEGRPEGMVTHRWVDPAARPEIEARVVPVDDLPALLPPDTGRVGLDERREEIRRRQTHAAWRYRT
jgi:hypothetical protein